MPTSDSNWLPRMLSAFNTWKDPKRAVFVNSQKKYISVCENLFLPRNTKTSNPTRKYWSWLGSSWLALKPLLAPGLLAALYLLCLKIAIIMVLLMTAMVMMILMMILLVIVVTVIMMMVVMMMVLMIIMMVLMVAALAVTAWMLAESSFFVSQKSMLGCNKSHGLKKQKLTWKADLLKIKQKTTCPCCKIYLSK